MKMRKTYIGGSTRLSRRRDRGKIGGVGSSDTREAHGRLDHCIKNAVTAMLPVVRRHDQCSLIGLLPNGVIHLRMHTPERRAVEVDVVGGCPEVLGKRGLRLVQIELLLLHLLPRQQVANTLLSIGLLHRQRNVMRIN